MLQVGDIIAFERKFLNKDVVRFTELSKDEGNHHVNEDEQGRLMDQGLLTVTLPTKVGGDNDVFARKMVFEFLRPMFTGDTISCRVEIKKHEREKKNRMAILARFTCDNEDGNTVLIGEFSGIILDGERGKA